jgi:hypothetical protein
MPPQSTSSSVPSKTFPPVKNGSRFPSWNVTAAFIVALVAVGAVIFVFIRSQSLDRDMDDLLEAYAKAEERVAALEKWRALYGSDKAANGEEAADAILPALPLSEFAPPADGRSLLPFDYQDCDARARSGEATVAVRYTNADAGISVDVPYNPEWGTDEYYVEPYDERDDAISFGGAHVFEACAWIREFEMAFNAAASAQDRLNQLNRDDSVTRAERLTVGGRDAVMWYSSGLCDYVDLEVVGAKHNYLFSSTCGAEDEIRDQLLRTAESIRLIEEGFPS